MYEPILSSLLAPTFFCSQWLSAAPSVLIHTSIAQTCHSLSGAMHICSFRHFVYMQRRGNILKVTLNVTLLQIWVFLSNTNIALSSRQADEKCRIGPGHGNKAGDERPTLAHDKNTCDSLWSSKRRQPAGANAGPSQNDCYKTGQACWDRWCLFSSWPHSIT